MIRAITSFIGRKGKKASEAPDPADVPTGTMPEVPTTVAPSPRAGARPDGRPSRPTYSKAFRWRISHEQTQPTTVEVVGSFNGWQKAALVFDPPTKTWQVTLHNIEGNRTHHYVMLVDGTPVYDKTCDGLTVPDGPTEARWQIDTDKGPRVMLLFGQAK